MNLTKGQSSFLKFGIPFLIFIVGGSFALKEFSSIKFEYYREKSVSPDEMKKHGIKMKGKGEVTLESEYDKIKTMDIDNWEQKRGPRPWEE